MSSSACGTPPMSTQTSSWRNRCPPRGGSSACGLLDEVVIGQEGEGLDEDAVLFAQGVDEVAELMLAELVQGLVAVDEVLIVVDPQCGDEGLGGRVSRLWSITRRRRQGTADPCGGTGVGCLLVASLYQSRQGFSDAVRLPGSLAVPCWSGAPVSRSGCVPFVQLRSVSGLIPSWSATRLIASFLVVPSLMMVSTAWIAASFCSGV